MHDIKIVCDGLRRKFYAACNFVFSNCYNVSEVVHLQLQESCCLKASVCAGPASTPVAPAVPTASEPWGNGCEC